MEIRLSPIALTVESVAGKSVYLTRKRVVASHELFLSEGDTLTINHTAELAFWRVVLAFFLRRELVAADVASADIEYEK